MMKSTPGQVLERTDVPTLAPDDPAFHIVRRKRDDRDGGLGRVTRRDPLECVRDERASPSPGFGPGLFLLLANASGQLVPDQVLRALEQVMLRLGDGQAGRLLQVRQRLVLRRLQVLLQLLDVYLAIGEALLSPLDLGGLALERELGLRDLRFEPGNVGAPVLNLGLDVGAQLDRELSRLDLRLAADRLGLPLGDTHARRAPDE